MNRRTLVQTTVVSGAAIVAGAVSSKFFWLGSLFTKKPMQFVVGQTTQGSVKDFTGESVLFRPGMLLRIKGKSAEKWADKDWETHTLAWDKGCVTDRETGAYVSNIQSLDLHVSASGRMVAVVEAIERRDVTPKTPHGFPISEPDGKGRWSLRKSRHVADVELDVTARSESWALLRERVGRLEECVRRADLMADHIEIDEWGAATDYRATRKALDEIGGA